MTSVTEKEFKEWLDGESYQPLLFDEWESRIRACVKLPLAPGFEFLYAQGKFQVLGEDFNRPMLFAGVYSKKHQKIYPYHWIFQRLYPNITHKQQLSEIKRAMVPKIHERIEKMLNNDRSNLKIQELFMEGKRRLEEYKATELEMAVKRAFIADVKSKDVQYKSEYYFLEKENQKLLSYIHDEDFFLENEAIGYIATSQEDILLQFKKNALLQEGLKDLEENWNESMVRLRGVAQAMKQAGADTVTIKMERDGEQIEFRYKAERFEKDLCLKFYDVRSIYYEEMQKLYAGQEIIPYEEVVEIKYGNECLYSAESYNPEQDFGQKMQ